MRICVYAGSNPGGDPAYAESAADLARLLAERGIGVVYGGAHVGLMGILADTALAAGGEVIGVMPQALMAELSDGFVALPGGAGTLEELIEVYTWSQLGIHDKPMGVLNVNGYYDGLAELLDHAVQEGFLRREHRAAMHAEPTPEALLERFAGWRPSALGKWL
jgi:predicted Rossmann-fold nucleotide-binding protein